MSDPDRLPALSSVEMDYHNAIILRADRWVVACGGKEPISQVSGKRYQLHYNPALHEHAYYCVDDDLFLTAGMEDRIPECFKH